MISPALRGLSTVAAFVSLRSLRLRTLSGGGLGEEAYLDLELEATAMLARE